MLEFMFCRIPGLEIMSFHRDAGGHARAALVEMKRCIRERTRVFVRVIDRNIQKPDGVVLAPTSRRIGFFEPGIYP